MIDGNFIVLLAFILFLTGGMKWGYRRSLHHLDMQINQIKAVLAEASLSFEKAKDFLQTEKERQEALAEEISLLVEKTESQIHDMQHKSIVELNVLLASKQVLVDALVDQTRLNAVRELQAYLSERCYETLSLLMREKADATIHEDLNERAIKKLEEVFRSGVQGNGGSTPQGNEASQKMAVS